MHHAHLLTAFSPLLCPALHSPPPPRPHPLSHAHPQPALSLPTTTPKAAPHPPPAGYRCCLGRHPELCTITWDFPPRRPWPWSFKLLKRLKRSRVLIRRWKISLLRVLLVGSLYIFSCFNVLEVLLCLLLYGRIKFSSLVNSCSGLYVCFL